MLDYELEFGLDGEFEDDDNEFEAELAAESEDEYESEEFLASLLPIAAPLAVKAIGSLFKESEFEDDDDEFEYELEAELESTPDSVDEAMMHHLANMAANSESEAEAEAFLGAIASLASKVLPKVAPVLIRGAAKLGKRLFRSRRTRRLLRTVPTIMRGTAYSLARQAAKGRPISSKTALRSLARNTARVFRSPRRTKIAMRRSRRYYPYYRNYRRSYPYRRRPVYAYK